MYVYDEDPIGQFLAGARALLAAASVADPVIVHAEVRAFMGKVTIDGEKSLRIGVEVQVALYEDEWEEPVISKQMIDDTQITQFRGGPFKFGESYAADVLGEARRFVLASKIDGSMPLKKKLIIPEAG